MSYYASFGERLPMWAEIDEEWYRAQRPGVEDEIREKGFVDLSVFHEMAGAASGLSPNPYFDETWYRTNYPDVREAISRNLFASGFEHYCCEGFKTRSPHWLFSETRYRNIYAGHSDEWLKKNGYHNGYDHFLNNSASSNLSGSLFFDPCVTQANLETTLPYHQISRCAYLDYLRHPGQTQTVRTSWFFDPVWYIETYPDIAEAISKGRYVSGLHHYLTNDTPSKFNPQPLFDEEAYRTAYPDVVPALESGLFRNAYAHFLLHGAFEGRRPLEDVDLTNYLERYQELGALVDENIDHPFRLFVSRNDTQVSRTNGSGELREDDCRALFAKEAQHSLPVFLRNTLDFTCSATPQVSVILVVHNQIALTVQTLSSLRANYAGDLDVILVDSGSDDLSRDIEAFVKGVHVIRPGYNIGFLQGANAALERVKAPFCLYLNNDIRLFPNAVEVALQRLQKEATIGAVGAKIVRTHMRLQEAGSIIWRNGATYGYRRQDDPTIGEVNFTRDVDYCSAAFLMVRAADARALGGFDPTFVPAYFEDTDFCLRLIEHGKRVIYDPAVAVEHMESGSFGAIDSHEWIQINHRVFAQRHRAALRRKPPPHVRNAVLGREQKRGRETILFIEDCLPVRRLGSGYARSNQLVRAMSCLGYQVSVFPMMGSLVEAVDLVQDFPNDVELLSGWNLARFAEFVEERAGYYDILWICRTHNLSRLLPLVTEYGRYLPMGRVILDTEVIDTPRRLLKAKLEGVPMPSVGIREMVSEELANSHFCQQIIAVSKAEAALVKSSGYEHVSVVGHALVPAPTHRPFSSRTGFLFVGALYGVDTPNYDSLSWMINDVLPLLCDMLEEAPHLTIAGYVGQGLNLDHWKENPNVTCLGPQADLRPFYESHRVFVAPTRYAGGLPHKVHEAASFGIPIVASRLLADEVGWEDGEAILSASTDDPVQFAKQVVALYTDEDLWARIREKALAKVSHDCDPAEFEARVEAILQKSAALSQN